MESRASCLGMGMFDTMFRRVKLSATDAAIAAVVIVAALNALVEFWTWLGQP